MSDIRISKLQHVSSHWKDFSGDISSAWTPEDVLGFGIWIHSSQKPLQLAKYIWNFGSSGGNDAIFLCERIGNSAES
jgi:hypothetical protein